MRTHLEGEDLFRLADTLGIALHRVRQGTDQLTGSAAVHFRVFNGLTLKADNKVEHSGVYENAGVAGIAVSVLGSLKLVLLVDVKAAKSTHNLRLWLVDASRIKGPFQPFPAKRWSRGEFYRALLPGVVAAYGRAPGKGSVWVELEDVIEEMGGEVANEAPDPLNLIGSKYRTVGPRGV
jgi:hypothetical protein